MKSCVILVGNGGVPSDCPTELVSEFKRLEAASKRAPTPEFLDVDRKLRDWPRTPRTDPYQAGLQAIAHALRRHLPQERVLEAYNEFCAPSLVDALRACASAGAKRIRVISTMFTRGGGHSEKEIPHILESFQKENPSVQVRYAWTFDLDAVAGLLAGELERLKSQPRGR